MLGRLNEGKYPSRAPIGYLDKSEAEKIGIKTEPGIKVVDPIRGPLLKKAFELYSTGEYTVQNLNKILTAKGFRSKGGKIINWKMLYKVLRHSFYYGYITYNNIMYKGLHKPLVSKALFDKVQLAIDGKANKFKKNHSYLLQGLVKCKNCEKIMRSITAKKRYQYFYCRKQDCGYKNLIQQEKVEDDFMKRLENISFRDSEIGAFKDELKNIKSDLFEAKKTEIKSVDLEIDKLESMMSTLIDKLVDGSIPEELYKDKKNGYMATLATYREKRAALAKTDDKIFEYIEELGKLLKNPLLLYRSMNFEQRRSFIKSMVENFFWDGNNLSAVWKKPFNLIAERPVSDECSPTENRTPIPNLKSLCPDH